MLSGVGVEIMRVLLPIDSSSASDKVIVEALSRPWPPESVFCVMNVMDTWLWSDSPQLIEDGRQQAITLLTTATSKIRQSGYEVSSEFQMGVPKRDISEFAKQWHAVLIMMGSLGLSAIKRFFLGSVAQAVLRSAPCSVEIVRTPESEDRSEGMKIVLGVDGSDFSAKALASIADRPWPAGSQVKVISVCDVLIADEQAASTLPYSAYSETVCEEILESARKFAQDSAGKARAILCRTGLQVCDATEEVPVGDPRVVLLDTANSWEADLIVVGSHGKRGFDRLLLGSVSEYVALHAKCSVAVIRP